MYRQTGGNRVYETRAYAFTRVLPFLFSTVRRPKPPPTVSIEIGATSARWMLLDRQKKHSPGVRLVQTIGDEWYSREVSIHVMSVKHCTALH